MSRTLTYQDKIHKTFSDVSQLLVTMSENLMLCFLERYVPPLCSLKTQKCTIPLVHPRMGDVFTEGVTSLYTASSLVLYRIGLYAIQANYICL